MAKNPAFQFYVKDWLTDPQLRRASVATRGVWIDILCWMWQSEEQGKLTGTIEEIGKLVSAENGDMEQFLKDAKKYHFCNAVTDHNNEITLINRRMYKDYLAKKDNALRQRRYRQKKKVTKKVTKHSPSPSPSPSPNIELTNVSSGKCPHQKIIDLYHQIIPEMPKVRIWNEDQESWLRARWKEDRTRQALTWWEQFFTWIRESDWLMGRTKEEFQCDLEWLIRKRNFAKIANGRYHKRRRGQYSGIEEWLRISQEKVEKEGQQ